MTKAGQRMIEGLKEAVTMKQLMDENERLRLELDMVQATILVPSQKDDRRTIERLKRELACAKDTAKWEADRSYHAVLDCNELVADNNTLREALKPFTDFYVSSTYGDDETFNCLLMVGDLRAARKALGETNN